MTDDEMTQIPCGHAFCKMCWERYMLHFLFDLKFCKTLETLGGDWPID